MQTEIKCTKCRKTLAKDFEPNSWIGYQVNKVRFIVEGQSIVKFLCPCGNTERREIGIDVVNI